MWTRIWRKIYILLGVEVKKLKKYHSRFLIAKDQLLFLTQSRLGDPLRLDIALSKS